MKIREETLNGIVQSASRLYEDGVPFLDAVSCALDACGAKGKDRSDLFKVVCGRLGSRGGTQAAKNRERERKKTDSPKNSLQEVFLFARKADEQ